MNHPAEVAIHSFLQNVMLGKTSMDKDILDLISKDVRDALGRQFSGEKKEFKLRMSNLGRKKCQLWFEKNHPEKKQPAPEHQHGILSVDQFDMRARGPPAAATPA